MKDGFLPKTRADLLVDVLIFCAAIAVLAYAVWERMP